jgi:hypothetical protein
VLDQEKAVEDEDNLGGRDHFRGCPDKGPRQSSP